MHGSELDAILVLPCGVVLARAPLEPLGQPPHHTHVALQGTDEVVLVKDVAELAAPSQHAHRGASMPLAGICCAFWSESWTNHVPGCLCLK